MKINLCTEYRTEIIISGAEASDFGITYETASYGSKETRKALWLIADEIKNLCGREIKLSGRVLIEMQKRKDGNIMIAFNRLSSPSENSVKQLVKSRQQPVMVEFSSMENICAAARACGFPQGGAIYENKGRYRMFIFADEENKPALAGRLSEFGEETDSGILEYARCRELWHRVLDENQVKNLSSLC